MREWRVETIQRIAEILDNERVPVREDDRPRGTVPYFGANGRQGWIDKALFNEPLILVAEDGGNFDMFEDRPIAYRIDGPSWVNNHAHVLRAAPGTDQGFLFWSLRNKDIRRWITGGTRSKLNRGELEQVELRVPPLEEQRRIAEILDTIDETIQATERVLAKLEQKRVGVVGRELADLQANAAWSTVDEAFEVSNGITLNPSRAPKVGATRYLRVANVRRGSLDLSDVSRLKASDSERTTKALTPGDLLVIEGHADPNEIGRCALVSSDAVGFLFQNHLFRLRPRSIVPEFAELWLNSESSRAYWRRMCSTSSNTVILVLHGCSLGYASFWLEEA